MLCLPYQYNNKGGKKKKTCHIEDQYWDNMQDVYESQSPLLLQKPVLKLFQLICYRLKGNLVFFKLEHAAMIQ